MQVAASSLFRFIYLWARGPVVATVVPFVRANHNAINHDLSVAIVNVKV
jgi:hypothetical protein